MVFLGGWSTRNASTTHQAQHWEELVLKIKKAGKAGHMYSPDAASSTTVHFWALQVVGAVKAAQNARQLAGTAHNAPEDKKLNICLQMFPPFLMKVVSNLVCVSGSVF